MVSAAAQQKIRCGQMERTTAGTSTSSSRRAWSFGPDENGFKKVIEYRFDDDGNKVRVTTTTRVHSLAWARLSCAAIEHRQWPKFGEALKEDTGSWLTIISNKETPRPRSRALKEDAGFRTSTSEFSLQPLIFVASGTARFLKQSPKVIMESSHINIGKLSSDTRDADVTNTGVDRSVEFTGNIKLLSSTRVITIETARRGMR